MRGSRISKVTDELGGEKIEHHPVGRGFGAVH